MVEHVSSVYMKGQIPLLIWERLHNSLRFTNKIYMKKIIITKTISRLACRVLPMVPYRYTRSDIAPSATHETRGDLLFFVIIYLLHETK